MVNCQGLNHCCGTKLPVLKFHWDKNCLGSITKIPEAQINLSSLKKSFDLGCSSIKRKYFLKIKYIYLHVIWLGNGSKNEAQLHGDVDPLSVPFNKGSLHEWTGLPPRAQGAGVTPLLPVYEALVGISDVWLIFSLVSYLKRWNGIKL